MVSRFFVALAFAPAVVLAQTAPAPAPRPVGGTLDLGYVSATGNTTFRSFSAGEKLTWRATSKLNFAQTLRSVYAKANDSTTANSFTAAALADYAIIDGVGFTAGAAYERDRFAGIERRTEESFGLVWRYASHAADSLRLETSLVRTQKRGIDSVEDDFTAARLAVWYKRPVGTSAYVQEAFEYLPNFDTPADWRLNSETAIVAPISRRIGIKLAFVVKYENVPEPTFKKTDQIFTAGVQVSY